MTVKRNTKQKQIIYQALCELGHPSATELFEYVHAQYPTISRGTVFRVLGGLTEEGRANKLHLKEGDYLFDATLTPHGHLRCRNCGLILDVPIPQELYEGEKQPFYVESYRVEMSGLCENCYKKLNRESGNKEINE